MLRQYLSPKILSLKMQVTFALSFTFSFFLGFSIADDCPPVTWSNEPSAAQFGEVEGTSLTSTPTVSPASNSGGRITVWEVKPGELNCRAWARTYDPVNQHTCKDIYTKYQITSDYFFWLNPTLETDCSNIQPKSRYCYDGCKL